MYIRLGRGFEKIVTQKKFVIGKIVNLKKPKKTTIVSTGSVTQEAEHPKSYHHKEYSVVFYMFQL